MCIYNTKTKIVIIGLCVIGKPMKWNFKEPQVSTPENNHQQYPREVRLVGLP